MRLRRRHSWGTAAVAQIACVGFLLTGDAAVAQSDVRVVRAKGYVDAAGEIVRDAVVVVRDGMIIQVGGEAPEAASVDVYEQGLISPGLIDIDGALGAFGRLSETSSPVQPAAAARDAFDRYSAQIRVALEAGVTTFALMPDDQNVIGGRSVVCRTAGADGRPCILSETGPMKLSIAPATQRATHEPTSRIGAIDLLRRTLIAAQKGPSGEVGAADSLRALAAGELRGVIATPSGADLLTAAEFAQTMQLDLVAIHDMDARQVASAAKSLSGVVIGPLELYAPPRRAAAGRYFESAGVQTAIAGGSPLHAAESLRIGAAVAARNGMSPGAARRAITIVPAEFLGVADRVGAIVAGRQADLAVFSGDPLDLRSRVLAVYVGGTRHVLNRAD